MLTSGWGNFNRIDATIHSPQSESELRNILYPGFQGIVRGLGRSYGDSSLANVIVNTVRYGRMLGLSERDNSIHCTAGLTLGEILAHCAPRGYFLPVVPGTQHVTVGGAIASDIHGKNHHLHGSFTRHVRSLRLLLPDGTSVNCSREENAALFQATCGGMGLTGVILDAVLNLLPVSSSWINQTIIRISSLEELYEQLAVYSTDTYSVAWLDCSTHQCLKGRSLLITGNHAETGQFTSPVASTLTIPFEMPGFLLNKATLSLFNTLYYARVREKSISQQVHYVPFFFPLDRINNWNRLYGKNGFIQYQFVLPDSAGLAGMKKILQEINDSKKGSFLAVLKAFGPANDNLLSFPIKGHSLALDFKVESGLLEMLDRLDALVADYGGRVYLAKDARMDKVVFRKYYPKWEEFAEIRTKYQTDRTFCSLQSRRLDI